VSTSSLGRGAHLSAEHIDTERRPAEGVELGLRVNAGLVNSQPARSDLAPCWKAPSCTHTEDFRWHDLRHTWASWHVQAGTPLFALQEMGGWSSAEMVRRYAHLAADHLAPFAAKLCRPLASVERVVPRKFGHNLVTVGKIKGLASLQALDYLVAGTCNRTRLLLPWTP
jgi:hypothetical protein